MSNQKKSKKKVLDEHPVKLRAICECYAIVNGEEVELSRAVFDDCETGPDFWRKFRIPVGKLFLAAFGKLDALLGK